MNLDRNEEALAAFEKAIEINPVYQDAILAAGVVAAKLGESQKSQDYLHEYLALNPGDQQVRLKIAADVAQAGDPRGALALIEDGLDMATAEPTVVLYAGHFALASARKSMEDPTATEDPGDATMLLEKSLQYYNRVYEQQADSVDATMLTNMIVANRLLERPQDAVAIGERAVKTVPDNAAVWSAYADALAGANRRDEVVQALTRVQQIDPTYAINARLGSWQLQDGNLSAAQASFRKAVQAGEVASGDEIARMIFGQGYNTRHKNKQFDTAISYYNVAREFASESATRGMVNFFHGYALFQKGLEVQKPSTAASARAALPLFQEAKRWLDQAGGYTEQASQRAQLLDNIAQYIEIQNALIKRG
jgi:tetratricopeptide (TPR) repeat protein